MSNAILLFLIILPILSVHSDDMEDSKKCAEELPAMYDKLCAKVKNDGNKVIAVKTKCIEYPAKLMAKDMKVSSSSFCCSGSELKSLSLVFW